MKLIQISLLLCTVLFATGCPKEPSKNLKDESTFVSNVNNYLKIQQGRFNCAREEQKKFDTASSACTTDLDSALEVAKRVRNDSIEDAIAVVDSNYNDYITNLDSRRSKGEYLLDIIELGTGAATGIAKGERPNQILGIALTAFRGGRKSLELNFYKQQTTPILISKMDDNRSKVYAAILSKRGKSANDYTIKEAIRDIVAYYNAGTLIRAFTELAKNTAVSAQESETVVRELKGENITISSIPSLKHESISDEVFAHSLSLAKQMGAAQAAAAAIPIPAPAVAPAPDNTPAINAAKAARAAKFNDIRPKYDAVWKKIEAEPKFATIITEMKTDPDLTAIFAKLPANRPDVTTEDFDLLLARFTSKVSRISKTTKNTELFEEFLKILQQADK